MNLKRRIEYTYYSYPTENLKEEEEKFTVKENLKRRRKKFTIKELGLTRKRKNL